MQVENEYGIYPVCDHEYMKYLQDLFEKVLGKDEVILFTVNPAVDRVMECGTIPTLFNTVDFGPGKGLELYIFIFDLQSGYIFKIECVQLEFISIWFKILKKQLLVCIYLALFTSLFDTLHAFNLLFSLQSFANHTRMDTANAKTLSFAILKL